VHEKFVFPSMMMFSLWLFLLLLVFVVVFVVLFDVVCGYFLLVGSFRLLSFSSPS